MSSHKICVNPDSPGAHSHPLGAPWAPAHIPSRQTAAAAPCRDAAHRTARRRRHHPRNNQAEAARRSGSCRRRLLGGSGRPAVAPLTDGGGTLLPLAQHRSVGGSRHHYSPAVAAAVGRSKDLHRAQPPSAWDRGAERGWKTARAAWSRAVPPAVPAGGTPACHDRPHHALHPALPRCRPCCPCCACCP